MRMSSSANTIAFNVPRISLAFVLIGTFLLANDCIASSNILCTEISYYNCDMCYNYTDSNQNSSTPVVSFSSCSRTICTNRTCRRVAGKTRCSCKQYKDVQLNQTKCLNTCCEGLGLTQFSLDALNQCQANSQKKQQQLKAILIGSLVGGIGGVIIIIILCVWCCRRRSKKRIEKEKLQQPRSSKQFITNPQMAQFTLNPSALCPICLQPQVDTLAKCNHQFHLKCLKYWVSANKVCPICKQSQSPTQPQQYQPNLYPNLDQFSQKNSHSLPTTQYAKIDEVKTFCQNCKKKCINIDFKRKGKVYEEGQYRCLDCS